jgi:hypothetical protein
MTHPSRQNFARLLLTIVLLTTLTTLSPAKPAYALSGSIVYNPSLNIEMTTCGLSEIGFTLTRTGTVDDDPGSLVIDWSVVLFVDGNGVVLNDYNTGINPIAGTITTNVSWPTWNNPTARPVTLTLYDTTAPAHTLADVAGAPVLSSFTIDPTELFPSACAGLLFGSSILNKCTFHDGRENCNDAGQTDAVYCKDGGVTVYALYKEVGYLAFTVTKAELASFPEKPARNTLIKQGKGAELYRLTSGELQLNGPNGYTYRWPGC